MAKQDFHRSCWNWHHAYVKSQGFYSNLRKIRVNERYNEKITVQCGQSKSFAEKRSGGFVKLFAFVRE